MGLIGDLLLAFSGATVVSIRLQKADSPRQQGQGFFEPSRVTWDGNCCRLTAARIWHAQHLASRLAVPNLIVIATTPVSRMP